MKHHYIILRYLACCLIISLSPYTLRAQYVYDYKRTANMYLAKGDYYAAAQYYEKYLSAQQKKTGKANYEPYMIASASKAEKKEAFEHEKTMYNLAESYRLYNDYTNAERWYAQVVKFDSTLFPLSRYWYGICLRANKNYAAAETQLSTFLDRYKTTDAYRANATEELKNVRFIELQLNSKTYHPATVAKMGSIINQGGATYAPVWYDDQTFIFTSSRPDSGSLASPHSKSDPYYNNLYQAAITDTGFAKAEKVKINMPANIQDGVCAYMPNKSKMFITEWVRKDGKNVGAIYASTLKDNVWTEPVKLNPAVNEEGYSSIQPFVTSDGKYLLFASDKPGGLGKYDLWYAILDADGNPSASVNLGTTINTPGDEEAPFYHAPTSTLVLASNGRIGMGGFDLYQSKGDFSQWSQPENMGYPINDVKDDIYFTSKGKRFLLTDASLSSDRGSVCCLEMFSVNRKNKFISGKVVECGTNEPLVGAVVSIVDTATNKVVLTQRLDASGVYSIEMEEMEPYKIVAEKAEHNTRSLQVRYNEKAPVDTLFNPTLCLVKELPKPFPVNRPVVLEGIYYDFDKATLRPESYPRLDTLAAVMRMYPNMQLELGAHTDGKGSVDYNLKLSDARARSCVEYLVKVGIDSSRLTSKGFGKCCPIAPNTLPNGKDDPGGRQLNRRTEFKVLHY